MQDVKSENTTAVGMPGRNLCMFLYCMNSSVWLILTLEEQNITSSVIEAQVFGLVAWVVIQRMTLPLCIFFRFHAAVFSLELWKEYAGKDKAAKKAVKMWKAFGAKNRVVEEVEEANSV